MLQKKDKDRLDKVLSVIETVGMRFPNAQIGREMDVDSGNLSSYLNGKKPIPDNFFTDFMKKYGAGYKEQEEHRGTANDTLSIISESNKTLAEANIILAKTNSRQFQLIEERLLSADAGQQNQLDAAPIPPDLLERIVAGGLASKYWKTRLEGAAIVRRWILTPSAPKESSSTQNGAGTSRK